MLRHEEDPLHVLNLLPRGQLRDRVLRRRRGRRGQVPVKLLPEVVPVRPDGSREMGLDARCMQIIYFVIFSNIVIYLNSRRIRGEEEWRHKPNQLSHYRRTANHSKRAAVLFMSSVSINTQIHQSLTPSVISFTVLRSSVTQLTLAAEDH